jgi:RNA-splicing ligase RtcB
MFEVRGKYTTAKIMIDGLDDETMRQIHGFINNPAFTNPVAIMPDAHAGKSSVVGFTMLLGSKLIPNTIGVDIGCGILSLNIGKTLPKTLADIDTVIRAKVPFGFNTHERPIINMEKDFPWGDTFKKARDFALAFQNKFETELKPPFYDMDWFLKKCADINHRDSVHRMICSLGSLGGGNHFLETGISDTGDHWFTIHTGSRNFGKCLCEYWQGLGAKKLRKDRKVLDLTEIEDIKNSTKDGKEIFRRIKEVKTKFKERDEAMKGLDIKEREWLESEDATSYLFDMIFAQAYAEQNRKCIAEIVCDILKVEPIDQIETVHNFIDFRDFIIRKGAIRSYNGERMVIPFNMRDGILICEGKSNPEWNYSAPHGAGRVMSRGQAKKRLDLETFKKQMTGIYSSSIGRGTLDESPDAYKDFKVIEQAITPTATIIGRIKPIHNMKDGFGESL